MQRWIAVSVAAVMLLVGGGAFAYYTYKQNCPAPVWIPLQINPGVSAEKRDQIVKDLKAQLSKFEILIKVSKDVGLKRKWHLGSDEEGAAELGKRLFVKVGEADFPMGKAPSLNIGVTGKYKEREVSGEITARLMDDAWKFLGINPPPLKKP